MWPEAALVATTSSDRIRSAVDFSVPHFTLIASSSDPFAGIYRKLFDYISYVSDLVEVEDSERKAYPTLPCLQTDGGVVRGFWPVCRAIAARAGLDGCSMREADQAEAVVAALAADVERLRPLVRAWLRDARSDSDSDSDEEEDNPYSEAMRAGLRTRLLRVVQSTQLVRQHAPILDARLRANAARTIVGHSVTWADYVLVHLLRTLVGLVGAGFLDQFPYLSLYYHKNHNL